MWADVAIAVQKVSPEGIAWLHFTQAALFTKQFNMHFCMMGFTAFSHGPRPALGPCWAFYFVIFLEQSQFAKKLIYIKMILLSGKVTASSRGIEVEF